MGVMQSLVESTANLLTPWEREAVLGGFLEIANDHKAAMNPFVVEALPLITLPRPR